MKITYSKEKYKNRASVIWYEDKSYSNNSYIGFDGNYSLQVSLDKGSSILLNVDRKTKKIIGVEGYFVEDTKNIRRFNFFDNSIKGSLLLKEINIDSSIEEGVFIPLINTDFYFDNSNNIFGYGNISATKCVEFGVGQYAYFNQKDDLCGIAIKLHRFL